MPDETVDTPFGKFLVNPAECIGATVKAGTIWDGPGFLQVIAREHGQLGEPGVTILDVGAHLGDWTVWLCQQGAWRVVAVEPAPYMVRLLKANLDLNKAICAEKVIVIPVAAYDRETTLTWTVPYVEQDAGGAALHDAPNGERIPAVRLDNYWPLFGDRVSLIKVDAQGCDFAALRGLRETIRQHAPVIVFEWEAELAKAHDDDLATCLRWLGDRLYDVIEWPSHPHNYLATPRRQP